MFVRRSIVGAISVGPPGLEIVPGDDFQTGRIGRPNDSIGFDPMVFEGVPVEPQVDRPIGCDREL
jgi:hypothetical protein